MKSILVGRLKKWMILAVIGCVAYFAGYIMGQRSHPIPSSSEKAEIKSK
jgi:hypothetical protein